MPPSISRDFLDQRQRTPQVVFSEFEHICARGIFSIGFFKSEENVSIEMENYGMVNDLENAKILISRLSAS